MRCESYLAVRNRCNEFVCTLHLNAFHIIVAGCLSILNMTAEARNKGILFFGANSFVSCKIYHVRKNFLHTLNLCIQFTSISQYSEFWEA